MPDVFDDGSILKLVSAAGLTPAVSRAQTERVAPTLRTETPDEEFLGNRRSGESRCRKPWDTTAR